MGRPSGTRSHDHDARRTEILQKLGQRLVARDAMHASYRELSVAAGVSISTLQHYFGRRADIVAAVLEHAEKSAASHLAHMRAPTGRFRKSIEAALNYMRLGFERFGLGETHALGFVEGMRDTAVGPLVVDCILEPSIDAIAARLAAHQARGEMRSDVEARHAAVMLLAPVVLIMLHQHELGGAAQHPADMDRFFSEHLQAFVRAHGVEGVGVD
jgi:AcrR family transcriptional regulator